MTSTEKWTNEDWSETSLTKAMLTNAGGCRIPQALEDVGIVIGNGFGIVPNNDNSTPLTCLQAGFFIS